ncbi:hypothetical protein [Caloranaerobacter sp. DY30410]|uniref:hypothetical protein n=1 Tax=Caloranaerobacter sp. DY30410 TaxID=3238305 RepID=UPI003D0008A7
MQEEIRQAQLELKCAENRFNNATTEDEIDIAIFDMKAAEMRLNNLLKLAKGEKYENKTIRQ